MDRRDRFVLIIILFGFEIDYSRIWLSLEMSMVRFRIVVQFERKIVEISCEYYL